MHFNDKIKVYFNPVDEVGKNIFSNYNYKVALEL